MRPEKLHIGAKNMGRHSAGRYEGAASVILGKPHTTPVELHGMKGQLLTRKQVAEIFQISPITVIRLEASGKLPAVRIGAGSVRYRFEDVAAFIDKSITGAVSA
jgi:excisionase family DNA binding protein